MANQLPAARKDRRGIQRLHARIGIEAGRQGQRTVELLWRERTGGKQLGHGDICGGDTRVFIGPQCSINVDRATRSRQVALDFPSTRMDAAVQLVPRNVIYAAQLTDPFSKTAPRRMRA
jgi:hypothetical protein